MWGAEAGSLAWRPRFYRIDRGWSRAPRRCRPPGRLPGNDLRVGAYVIAGTRGLGATLVAVLGTQRAA